LKIKIEQWVSAFKLDGTLRMHLVVVVCALPDAVREDLLGEDALLLCEYEAGLAMSVPVSLGVSGRSGRSVALRRSLRFKPVEFIRYVIAHELAHAHLRNEGRQPDEDPEHAADALAAEWGFPRP